MKRFFITTAVIVLAAGAGWRYAPLGMRESMLGFIGIARSRSGTAVRDAVSRALPDDPLVRRAAAAAELRRTITEMEKRAGISAAGGATGETQATAVPADTGAVSGADMARKAEGLIRELESSVSEPSLPRRVAERVLDAILPASKRGAECPAE